MLEKELGKCKRAEVILAQVVLFRKYGTLQTIWVLEAQTEEP